MTVSADDQVDAIVADDDPDVRALVRSTLARIGLSAREASDGQELLDLFTLHEERFPDRLRIVLSDIGMPLVNGIEATRRIQATRPDVCVILMTGFTDPSTLDQAARSGARRVMNKPVDPVELESLLAFAASNAR